MKYERSCPECSKIIKYKYPSNYYTARKKNSLCKSCIQKGERHKYFKKTLPEHVKQQKSLNWTGDKNPNYGGNWSKSHRKNLSNSLRKSKKIKELAESKKGIPRSEDVKHKIRLKILDDLKQKYGQIHPNYNKKACQLFDELNKEMGWAGQHAENGGEFHIKELGYWVDYYEPNLNLVIEYDEKKHKNQKEKDRIRQKEIENHLNCKFIRINEDDENKLELIQEKFNFFGE